jgi:hypothetical protein
MRLSRIYQNIKDEPCAKQRALLGVSCSRFSSVSRGVLSGAFPIFSERPLKPLFLQPEASGGPAYVSIKLNLKTKITHTLLKL